MFQEGLKKENLLQQKIVAALNTTPAITRVTVTGAGTQLSPWAIELLGAEATDDVVLDATQLISNSRNPRGRPSAESMIYSHLMSVVKFVNFLHITYVVLSIRNCFPH